MALNDQNSTMTHIAPYAMFLKKPPKNKKAHMNKIPKLSNPSEYKVKPITKTSRASSFVQNLHISRFLCSNVEGVIFDLDNVSHVLDD